MVYVAVTALLAALDLVIKNEIEDRPDEDFPREIEQTGGRIILRKTHNSGFSFGLLKKHPQLVTMLPLACGSFFAGMFAEILSKKGRVLEKTAFSLVLAGAASNLFDRLARGYVVDYFSIKVKKLEKVVFNLGDLFILLGAGLYMAVKLVGMIKEKR